MKFKNILILYKESNYRLRFSAENKKSAVKHSRLINQEKLRFKKEHDEHYASLDIVKSVLKKHNIKFTVKSRGRKHSYAPYDCILTIGGDGTFLEAARNAGNHIILGINSAPKTSVGRFCLTNAENFERYLNLIQQGKLKPVKLYQITGHINDTHCTFHGLNEFLICHYNPSALSRYKIEIGKVKEVHRSSGIWIATAAGSSAAIKSAGGKKYSITSKNIQYKPRELYYRKKEEYKLKGGLLKGKKMKIVSLMRKAYVFVDGAHIKYELPYGATVNITQSKRVVNAFVRHQ